MPRPLRLEFENAWYHVMNRGANRQLIFKTTAHRNLFYTMLGEIVDEFKIEIHAYCLMSNHYHLLIKTPYANLSKAMKHLDGVYTQRFNRSIKRDGPLFRGRYKAILVDSDEYVLQVSRYIHLNPVAAKICHDPGQFIWSSYQSYQDSKKAIIWLTTSSLLSQMTGTDSRESYMNFVRQGDNKEVQDFYSKKQLPSILGNKKSVTTYLGGLDSRYAEDVLTDINRTNILPGKEAVIGAVLGYFNTSNEILFESIRGKQNIVKLVAIYLMRREAMLSHGKIAEIFGVKGKSISSIVE